MSYLHSRTAEGSIDEVGKRLEERLKAHNFGVLGVIDLKAKMKEKGVEFGRACRIYEVYNPEQAKKALEAEIKVAAALPCRIAVYQEGK